MAKTTKKDTKPRPTKLGRMVKAWRTRLGLKQSQAAKRLGIAQSGVSNIETGIRRTFREALAAKIQRVCGS